VFALIGRVAVLTFLLQRMGALTIPRANTDIESLPEPSP